MERLTDFNASRQVLRDPAELAKLLHELRVRQVELEMRNEELLDSRAESESSTRRLTELYDFAPVGYFSVTTEGRIRNLNLMGAALLGCDRAALQGEIFRDFVARGDRATFDHFLAKVLTGGDAGACEIKLDPPLGHESAIQLAGVLSPDRSACRMAAMHVTDRKEAEDALRVSEAKFRSIIESNPTAIYLYQLMEDGRIVLTGSNPAADRETGINHSSLFGMAAEEAFPSLIGTGIPEKFKEVAAGGASPQTFIIRYTDPRISGVFDVRVFQTGPGTIAVAFQDISERTRAEEELKSAHDELENRVRKRTSQLQERTQQLSALAREMTRVEERERQRIAALIHDDLQQMLVAALLNLGMLKTRISDSGGAEDLMQIEGILRDSIQTTRSLTAELSPSVLQQCSLAPALHWLRTWCIEKYGLEVVVEATEEVDPGPEAYVTLFRCVRELLFNIVKHAGVKSANLKMTRCLDGMVRIVVSDEGGGFDPEAVQSREGSARGFGLFSIRERLDLLGGGFEIDSSPGCGSRFTLWVPLLVPARSGMQEKTLLAIGHQPSEQGSGDARAASRGEAGRKIRIVVADNHGAVRAGLVRVLESEADFEVVGQAVDGFEALQLARLLLPDAVITDLNMPRMNGLQLTTVIHRELPAVKVLGLSIETDAERRSAMIRAGALDLLCKNQPAAQLVARLRSHSAVRNAASVPES